MLADVRLIAAVGQRGQIGIRGRLPWSDPKDLVWFWDQTKDGVVIVGRRTAEKLPPLPRRRLVVWGGKSNPGKVIADQVAINKIEGTPERVIWIAGGAYTYQSFMSFVRYSLITRIDYDGPADTFMPPLWEQGSTVATIGSVC
jgi:dihydromethanopterin reductase